MSKTVICSGCGMAFAWDGGPDIAECKACGSETPITKNGAARLSLILTTSPSVEGAQISGYLGIVSSQVVFGVGLGKDILAGIRDVIGGRSETIENAVSRMRVTATRELTEQAVGLGAGAVISVKYDYEVLGANNGMLMLAATGTAVSLDGHIEQSCCAQSTAVNYTTQGAVVKGNGDLFAIAMAGSDLFESVDLAGIHRDWLRSHFSEFALPREIILAQREASGAVTYQGRSDLVSLLANTDPGRIPWGKIVSSPALATI